MTAPGRIDSINAICEQVAASTYDDLPADVISATKQYIIETIAVTSAGRDAGGIREFIGVLTSWGGSPESSVMLDGQRLPASEAVLANVAMASTLQLGNFHASTGVQPIAPTLWSAAAFAETCRNVSGKQFLTAIALGSDLIVRMAVATRNSRALGHHPAIYSGFGAAAAVGKLKGFDAVMLRNALGIMLSQASATLQAAHDGADVCNLQFAFNASDGFRSAEMAQLGVIGVRRVIDGEFGFARMFARAEADHSMLLGRIGAHDYAGLTRAPESLVTSTRMDDLIDLVTDIERLPDVDRVFTTLRAVVARNEKTPWYVPFH